MDEVEDRADAVVEDEFMSLAGDLRVMSDRVIGPGLYGGEISIVIVDGNVEFYMSGFGDAWFIAAFSPVEWSALVAWVNASWQEEGDDIDGGE